MSAEQIINALEALAEMRAQRVVMAQEYDVEIAKLEAMRDGVTEEISDHISTLESEIKRLVVDHGQSVRGASLQAVYSKPRVTWDSKALDGFALNHPELFAFRKEGSPSVSIRTR